MRNRGLTVTTTMLMCDQQYCCGDFNPQLRSLLEGNPRYSLCVKADGCLYTHTGAVDDLDEVLQEVK
jgi:hypothetical protein